LKSKITNCGYIDLFVLIVLHKSSSFDSSHVIYYYHIRELVGTTLRYDTIRYIYHAPLLLLAPDRSIQPGVTFTYLLTYLVTVPRV